VNAVLLAAGYATRLYPLTKDRPKPLLPVGGRPMIDYVIDELQQVPQIERLLLITNAKFRKAFEAWACERDHHVPLQIIDDGSTSNENRLGAIGDLERALRHADAWGQPAYVLATDNLARFDLRDIIALHEQKHASAVFTCRTDPERLKRVGVAVLDKEGRIIDFEEKPPHPKSDLRVPPFYVYTAEAVDSVPDYLESGNNPDAPGYFLSWVVKRLPVYGLTRPEGTHDIGTLESYRAVCQLYDAPYEPPGEP